MLGYIMSMATLTFLIFWVYPWDFIPYYIDKGVSSSISFAVAADIGLLLLFGLQHSLMARDFFKDNIISKLSGSEKASLYSIASSLFLILIFYFWQPVDTLVWDFKEGVAFWVMSTLYVLGWSFAFVSSFLIDHFELFGLHQGYRAFKNLPEPELSFQTKLFYNYVRHPIQLGTIIGLWATPSMSLGHFLLSAGFTVYVVIGLYFEEKSLVKTFGEEYRRYQKEVPMLIPFKL